MSKIKVPLCIICVLKLLLFSLEMNGSQKVYLLYDNRAWHRNKFKLKKFLTLCLLFDFGNDICKGKASTGLEVNQPIPILEAGRVYCQMLFNLGDHLKVQIMNFWPEKLDSFTNGKNKFFLYKTVWLFVK